LTLKHLLDVNVLIALTDRGHQHHQKAREWFTSSNKSHWGICPITESGFIRIMSNPVMREGTRLLDQAAAIQQAIAILQHLKAYPGFHYWEITESESWVRVTAPLTARITGHQQITDAYLLGLAIAKHGVLATFDRGLKFLAGAKFAQNLLVLET
jgi:uncharacterized protein